MTKRRVVVTGLGIVSPVGNDLAESWKNIIAGVSGIDTIKGFDASNMSTQMAGEIKGFDVTKYIPAKEAPRMDKFIHYGIAAGVQAVEDSGLDKVENLDKERVGLIIGSGIGGLGAIADNSIILKEKGPRKISPFFIPSAISNMVAGHLSIRYGFTGVNYGIVSACATANHCIGDGMRYIQHGDLDVVVVGGAEGAVVPIGIAGFAAMRATSSRNDEPSKASRPWDKGRDGFVMGEGSAILILEEYEHAIKRGAKIYAELVGYGASSDANHITAPTVEGPARSMKQALKSAGLNGSEIGYINAHGTSTPLGDINETNAIKNVFNEHAYKLSISSTKSMTGHLLGAASAIEAVFSIMALKDGVIPPTINLENQDEQCDLDYTANKANYKQCDYAMSNSFGFGGTNSTVIFKHYKG